MGTLILEPNWYYPITNTWDAVLHVHGDNLSNAPRVYRIYNCDTKEEACKRLFETMKLHVLWRAQFIWRSESENYEITNESR